MSTTPEQNITDKEIQKQERQAAREDGIQKAAENSQETAPKAIVSEITDPGLRRELEVLEVQRQKMNVYITIARQFFKAGCYGKDIQNPEQAFVKIMAGAEMGMGAAEAMNSLYLVNGQVTPWGQAISKKLRAAGWSIDFHGDHPEKEITAVVEKDGVVIEETSNIEMKVLKNSRAMGFAPEDKLKWHALGRIVRFKLPEIMGGVCSYLAEEAESIPMDSISLGIGKKQMLRNKKNAVDITSTPTR